MAMRKLVFVVDQYGSKNRITQQRLVKDSHVCFQQNVSNGLWYRLDGVVHL
jgi:hypothetical protein